MDSGFLERGFICINVWEFALLVLSHFLKYPMKMKSFGGLMLPIANVFKLKIVYVFIIYMLNY